jgi:pyruvyltransferase
VPVIPRNIRIKFKKPIKLYWWRDTALGTHGNFGDEITKVIIENLYYRKVRWAEPWECQMIGAGSLLSDVFKRKKQNKPLVWTSGFLEDDKLLLSDDDFEFAGVRGNLSKERITTNNELQLGDAGLLASFLNKGNMLSKTNRLGIIPHYIDASSDFIRKIKNNDGVNIINPTDDLYTIIKAVSSCEAILSSSLHGLIIADSLGVPNRHLVLSANVRGAGYKFRDYYSIYSTERYKPLGYNQIRNHEVESLMRCVNDGYLVPHNLEGIKKSILESFPM